MLWSGCVCTFAVGWVGGGVISGGGPLLLSRVCGGVENLESGVSGEEGEYADWDTAGTWWADVTLPPPDGNKAYILQKWQTGSDRFTCQLGEIFLSE